MDCITHVVSFSDSGFHFEPDDYCESFLDMIRLLADRMLPSFKRLFCPYCGVYNEDCLAICCEDIVVWGYFTC